MNRYVLFVALASIGLSIARESQAAIIHESAHLGATGLSESGVPALHDGQYIGSRFSLSGLTMVESVGGHLVGSSVPFDQSLFAAIVFLSSPTALPSGSPFDMTTVTTTVFTPPYPSDDVLVPLTVTLNPGHYGLIFGVGHFGAIGPGGAMPSNNFDIQGSASYFHWSIWGPSWFDENVSGLSGFRFVVTGRVIPEPGSIALFVLGSLCACGFDKASATPQFIESPAARYFRRASRSDGKTCNSTVADDLDSVSNGAAQAAPLSMTLDSSQSFLTVRRNLDFSLGGNFNLIPLSEQGAGSRTASYSGPSLNSPQGLCLSRRNVRWSMARVRHTHSRRQRRPRLVAQCKLM